MPLWIVGLSHLKISATKQCENIKFCVLLHKSPLETLRILEEVYGKVVMKKTLVYEWHKHFYDCHAAGDHQRCVTVPNFTII
jgi:hypothetical protein